MLPDNYSSLVERLGQRFNEPNLLAQVLQAIDSGKAIPVFRDPLLLILKPMFDDIGRPGVFTWIGVSANGRSRAEDFQFVYQMAKATDMKFIRFETKRKGFVKLGARYGYQAIGVRGDYTIYQKEV